MARNVQDNRTGQRTRPAVTARRPPEELDHDIQILEPAALDRPAEDGIILSNRVGLGEAIAVLTLLYASTIASFNAGYFSQVSGNFSEFFSFTDLLSTNLTLIQYLFAVIASYGLFSVFLASLRQLTGAKLSLTHITESIALKHTRNPPLFWAVYGAALISFIVLTNLISTYNVTNFSLSMLPSVIFQGGLLYFWWAAYKHGEITARTLAVAILLTLIVFSNNAGWSWVKSEIGNAKNVQSIVDKDGTCLERIILRNSSSGLLLYNPLMKQFEFRSKDWFKTIFPGRSCI